MVQVNFPKDFQNGNVTIENCPTRSDKKNAVFPRGLRYVQRLVDFFFFNFL